MSPLMLEINSQVTQGGWHSIFGHVLLLHIHERVMVFVSWTIAK
jgi:hypothetical protein